MSCEKKVQSANDTCQSNGVIFPDFNVETIVQDAVSFFKPYPEIENFANLAPEMVQKLQKQRKLVKKIASRMRQILVEQNFSFSGQKIYVGDLGSQDHTAGSSIKDIPNANSQRLLNHLHNHPSMPCGVLVSADVCASKKDVISAIRGRLPEFNVATKNGLFTIRINYEPRETFSQRRKDFLQVLDLGMTQYQNDLMQHHYYQKFSAEEQMNCRAACYNKVFSEAAQKSGLCQVFFDPATKKELDEQPFQPLTVGGLTWFPQMEDFENAFLLNTQRFAIESPGGTFEVILPWNFKLDERTEQFVYPLTNTLVKKNNQVVIQKILQEHPENYACRRDKNGRYHLTLKTENNLEKLKNTRDLLTKTMIQSLRLMNNPDNFEDKFSERRPENLYNVRFYPRNGGIPQQLVGDNNNFDFMDFSN